jgi:transcriptional regulator
MSEEVLRVETGSLYPALHRLEAHGWISSDWKLSDKGKRAKYYRLTRSGRKQLVAEQSKWDQLTAAMARVLRPAE